MSTESRSASTKVGAREKKGKSKDDLKSTRRVQVRVISLHGVASEGEQV